MATEEMERAAKEAERMEVKEVLRRAEEGERLEAHQIAAERLIEALDSM